MQPESQQAVQQAVFVIVALSILATMAIALLRAGLGPTVFDRVLALNAFGTKTVLLLSVVDFILGRPDFLDLALLYSLMNFIGTIAMLRFSKYGHFDDVHLEAAGSPPAATESSR